MQPTGQGSDVIPPGYSRESKSVAEGLRTGPPHCSYGLPPGGKPDEPARTNRCDPPGPSMVLLQRVPQETSFRGDLGWCWQHPLEATRDEVGVPCAANQD